MSDPNAARPSWFRWLRRLGLTAVVLITLAALFHATENFRGRRAWERYRKDAEVRGLKLDFAAYIPKPVPDAENGANTPFVQSWFPKPRPDGTNYWPTKYSDASQLITVYRRSKGSASQDDRFFTDLVAWQRAFERLKEPKDRNAKKIQRNSHGVDLDAREQAAAAAVVLGELKVYEPALAELHAMSAHRKVRYPIDYKLEEPFSILLPHLAKLKGIVQTLNLQACAQLAAGQTNEAFNSIQLMLWLCDSLDDEMFLISQLVCIAGRQIAYQVIWEGLARHKWSEAQLQQIQEQLLHTDFISALDRCLADERAGGIAAIDWIRKKRMGGNSMAIFDDPEGIGGASRNSGGALLGWIIPNGWFYFEMKSYAQLMDQATQGAWDSPAKLMHPRVADQNFLGVTEQFKRGPVDSVWHHYLFARLLMPALEKSSTKFARAQSTAFQVALACAVERYRLATGKYPDALAGLMPKYLTKIPHEVVSENPMHYQQTPDGFVLYSAGWDGKDDHGEFLRAARDGEPEKGDWVWRSAP